jgi:hypothetical protein
MWLSGREPQRDLELGSEARFAAGNLSKVRAYIELMAPHNLGRSHDPLAKTAAFVGAYQSWFVQQGRLLKTMAMSSSGR